MSMTLEKCIETLNSYAKSARNIAKDCLNKDGRHKLIKTAEKYEQEAEWLKELSERRKQPERKVGKWTEDNACEFCGFKPWYERDIHTLSYCPNCGADMRGEQYE